MNYTLEMDVALRRARVVPGMFRKASLEDVRSFKRFAESEAAAT